MSEMNEKDMNKLGEEALDNVSGGNYGGGGYDVIDIGPYWIRCTARDGLNCRYWPNGEIAKVYEYGHKLKINGITTDGKWYRLLIYDPRGGTCDGYIWKASTEVI